MVGFAATQLHYIRLPSLATIASSIRSISSRSDAGHALVKNWHNRSDK